MWFFFLFLFFLHCGHLLKAVPPTPLLSSYSSIRIKTPYTVLYLMMSLNASKGFSLLDRPSSFFVLFVCLFFTFSLWCIGHFWFDGKESRIPYVQLNCSGPWNFIE